MNGFDLIPQPSAMASLKKTPDGPWAVLTEIPDAAGARAAAQQQARDQAAGIDLSGSRGEQALHRRRGLKRKLVLSKAAADAAGPPGTIPRQYDLKAAPPVAARALVRNRGAN